MLDAMQRFPLALLCGAIGTACAIVGIHHSKDDGLVGQCERLAMTVAFGLPLLFALRMLRENGPGWRRWPLELLGVPLLAWWFLVHSARPADEPGIVFIRWALLLAALHLLAAVSPYLRGQSSRVSGLLRGRLSSRSGGVPASDGFQPR